jgi:hypothetical protein
MLDHEPSVDRRAALKALREDLDALPGPRYETHIDRSRDLIRRDSSPLNPLRDASEGDGAIANPKLTGEQRTKVAGATVIAYGSGNQQGAEFLAAAVYDGTLESFLKGFFP